MSWVAPPPKLPQPPDTPFAVPTTGEENIELIQNWVETKVASEKPVKKRTRRKETAELITAVQNTTGAVASMSDAVASRGPKRSHAVPMTILANTAPETAAMPALPMSVAVRLRLSRMTGSRGGAANDETKQQKKENQARWNARMCGAAAEKRRNSVALCSESTGMGNFCGSGVGDG